MSLTEVSLRVVANSIQLISLGKDQAVAEPSCHLDGFVLELHLVEFIDILALLFANLVVPVVTTSKDRALLGDNKCTTFGAVNGYHFALNIPPELRCLRKQLISLAEPSGAIFSRAPREQSSIICQCHSMAASTIDSEYLRVNLRVQSDQDRT